MTPATASTAGIATAGDRVLEAQGAVAEAQTLLREAAGHLNGRVQAISAQILLADLVLLERKLSLLLEVIRHTLRTVERGDG